MPHLRQSKLRRSRDDLKRIADALGAVRDEDVAIMALEELKREAPEEMAAGLDRLTAERAARREEARAALTDAISEGMIARAQGKFIFALEHGAKTPRLKRNVDADGEPHDASPSFRQVGKEIITNGFAELQHLSASLYRPFKTEPLHRMRIAAKRLRYAVELFAPCWGGPMTESAEEIAEMQAHLGELHDCDVWIEGLGARLRRSSKTSASGPETEESRELRCAARWLLGQFVKARTKHYRAALKRWHDWETQGFAARLASSLDAEPEPVELAPLTLSPAEAVASDLQNA